ncbi:translocation/assembly module TamB domain-containing protein [Marivita hallyeonensis]|uniref:translocation/assembly module TamB domain-containing protein n=1 Tax=Marivita hallyeonensis TaxID=996342 RepID=UPI0015B6A813|nr:translocation/assembly module TamB domain-containing protein [Marivita hallyeonensis]
MTWLLFPLAAAAQDDDPGYLAGLLQDALSGAGRDVQIRGFQGALSSEASIALLSISDEQGEWFRAENVVLEWTRSALLRGIVDVDAFTAERIVVSRAPISEAEVPSAEATPFQIPELPVSIDIEEINAQSVILGEPLIGEEAEFSITGAASLDGGGADIQFDLSRIDGEDAQIRLAASFDPSSRELSIDLAAEEQAEGIVARLLDIPGQPALSLTVQGAGNLEEFNADLALATDGEPRVTGNVIILAPEGDASWDLQVDITGDPTPVLPVNMRDFFGNNIGLQARVLRESSGRIDLPQFTLSARTLSLTGSGALAANGWPEALDVEGRLENPEGGPVVLPVGDGETRVGGITFDATYDDVLTFDAQIDTFENPAATLETLSLTGRGNIAPAGPDTEGRLDFTLSLDADGIDMADPALAAAVGPRVTGDARIDYIAGQPVRITGIDLAGADYGLTGATTWDAAQTIPLLLDLRLVAQDIVRFSELAGRDLSGRAEMRIDGAVGPLSGMADVVIDATTLDIQVGQDVADRVLSGVGSVRLDVRRDETGTTVRSARIATSAANIEAAGKITSESTAFRFGGELRSLDRLYPGEAQGRADLSGTIALSGVQLQRMEVNAELSNQTQRVALPFDGGMTLRSAIVDVIATGGPNGSWTTQVQARDLRSGTLGADLLDLSGSGPLSQGEDGMLVSVGGDLAANAAGLRMTDARLSQALGAAPSVVAEFNWTQASERLEIETFALDTGTLDATGTAVVNQTLTAPDAQFSATITAEDLSPLSGLAGQRLQGRGTMDVTGAYAQGGPFEVSVTGQAAGLGIGNPTVNRLLAGVTRFDLGATGSNGTLSSVRADVSNPEISAQISGPLSNLSIAARLQNVGLVAPDFQGPLSVDGTVGQQNGGYLVDVNVTAPGNTTLAVDGTVASGSSANLSIVGSAPLGLANAFIEPRRVNGRAQLDLALRGPLALTSLSGTVTPVGAELSAPTLGIVLSPIDGQIQMQNGAAQIGLTGVGNNGGSIDVNGRLALQGFDANLTATLNRFGVRDPELYDTSVDGTVSLTGGIGRNLLVSGDLRLNETEIRVPSSGAFALGDIPNIEHLGATRPVMRTIESAGLTNEGETRPEPRQATTRLNLTLSAPNQVFVRGRGLDAELGGSLTLTGPTTDIIPQGGFELVRGRLDVLNQRFVLDEGRIQMSGSFVPVLRFVASTEANGIVVNVILDGPASSPDISFTSTPELPEDEVLAQLLFGRNLSNLSALQALELANAVATLAGGGSGGLLSNLRDGFGLDDLDVSQTADGNTAVRAGAYISENIYTDVVVEGGGRTEINLNLDITSDITARGSVSNDGNSSLGIFFERDY